MKTLFLFFLGLALFAGKTEQTGYEIGSIVENFKLKDVSGEMISLSDYEKEKGVIVIFSCNSCPYVVMYEDRMIALHKRMAELGFPVLAINPNDLTIKPEDSFEEMVKRSTEKGFPFRYVRDEDQAVAKKFGATRTPQVYLLQKEGGKFIVRYIGAIDDNPQDAKEVQERYVDFAVQQILKNRMPEPAVTKAIGCTIKWTK